MSSNDKLEELTTNQIDSISWLLYNKLVDSNGIPVVNEDVRQRIIKILSHFPLFTDSEKLP